MAESPRLLLAEDESHVRDMLRRGWGVSRDRWIALGPWAMAELEARSIDYAIPEDFHRWDELELLCGGLRERLEAICDELDGELHARDPALARASVRPFRFEIISLAILLDGLGSRTWQLSRLLEAHPGLTATIHARPAQPPGAWGILFSPQERLWGRVVGLFAAGGGSAAPAYELLADPLAPPDRRARSRPFAVTGRRLIASSLTLSTLALGASRGDVRGAARSLLRRGDSVIVVDGQREWTDVLPVLREAGLRTLFAFEERFTAPAWQPGAGAGLDPRLAQRLTQQLTVAGVSLYPLLADRLGTIWREGPRRARRVARRTRSLLARSHARALLRGATMTGGGHALNVAAREADTVVCAWQHGMVFDGPSISQQRDVCDMMTTDLVLAFGEGPARGYRHSGGRWRQSRVAVVGSTTLDRLADEEGPARIAGSPRVLYATTNYYGNEWHIGFSPGLSDRRLYRDQRRILATLRELAGAGRCRVRVKLHPACDVPWSGQGGDGVEVIRDEASFNELLADTDIVVLDLPSTTLLQALAARRSTVVLTAHWRPEAPALALLRRAATVCDTAQQLCDALVAEVMGGAPNAGTRDEAFLEEYGTQPGRRVSAARAADAVMATIAGGCSQTPTSERLRR